MNEEQWDLKIQVFIFYQTRETLNQVLTIFNIVILNFYAHVSYAGKEINDINYSLYYVLGIYVYI